jgi:23S rRNA (guanosine2251-2'-O)-methyltransferase
MAKDPSSKRPGTGTKRGQLGARGGFSGGESRGTGSRFGGGGSGGSGPAAPRGFGGGASAGGSGRAGYGGGDTRGEGRPGTGGAGGSNNGPSDGPPKSRSAAGGGRAGFAARARERGVDLGGGRDKGPRAGAPLSRTQRARARDQNIPMAREAYTPGERPERTSLDKTFGSRLGTPQPRNTGPRTSMMSTTGPRGLGGELVEGRQAVRELLMAGKRRVRDVWMAEGTDDSPILAEIEALAAEARITVRKVSRDQLHREAHTETPQGVLAHAAEIKDVAVDSLFKLADGRASFIVAVDSLTDPQNLGALLRSAEGAGVTGVILPRHRNVHITPSVTKAAAGAIERIPMAIVGGLPAAMLAAKTDHHAWFVGLDADGPSTIYDLAHLSDVPLVVVVGAEGSGLSRLVAARCDTIASIPLRGALSSLNASAAGAIAMFELGRHRPLPNPTAAT